MATSDVQAGLRLEGVDLYYREAGEGSPLLLVHGSGGDADSWGGRFEALARRHRVIAYDRRGFRRSVHPPVRDFRRHAADAAALLERLQAAPATVVGWSGGGLVALELAMLSPGLVRTLVLVEPPLHVKAHPTLQAGLAFLRVQVERRLRGPRPAIRGFLRWASSYSTGGCAFDRMPVAMQEAMLATAEASLGDLDAGTGEDLPLTRIASLPMPIVCLLGEKSTPAIANATRRIVAAVPGVRLITIPGAGHAIPFDRPDEFVDAVLSAAASPLSPTPEGPTASDQTARLQ